MPESRSRSKQKKKGYTPPPPRRKPGRKASPKWYVFLIVGVMAVGVAMIVGNYMGLMPGTRVVTAGVTNVNAKPLYMWIGLGCIGLGFLGSTRWR